MNRSIYMRAILATTALVIASLGFAATASATLPGKNGPILLNSIFGFSTQSPKTVVSEVTPKGKITPILKRSVLVEQPAVSPNGNRIVYQGVPGYQLYTSVLARPNRALRITNAPKTTVPSQGVFAADGKSVYFSTTSAGTGGKFKSVLKQYFFASRKTKIQQLKTTGGQGLVLTDVSANGRIALFTDMLAPKPEVYVGNLVTGALRVLTTKLATIEGSLSPDGRRIAYSGYDKTSWDVFVSDLSGKLLKRVTRTRSDEYYPIFSPDGTKLVYTSTVNSKPKNIRVTTVKSGKSRVVKTPAPYTIATQWLTR